MTDNVYRPPHYQLFPDGDEVIDVIRSYLTDEEFIGYCKGNILKYRLRAGHKGDAHEDHMKSDRYHSYMHDKIMEIRNRNDT